MRLLHTSDWHLGRRFFGRSLLSDQEYVLDQMLNLVRDLNPDTLVVTGDIFDQRRPDEEALALFHDTLNRLLELGTVVIFLAGPSDDFRHLHLGARWVRDAGVYLFEDATQVLSPLSLRGARDSFDVNTWCLPFPKTTELSRPDENPALFSHSLVEKVVQRLNPNEVNIFLGYAWAQDAGRPEELGALVKPGGQPLEKRLLDFFDVSALGGRHSPHSLGSQAFYCGSLLCYEAESESPGRSVTFYDILSKGEVMVDHYPLRPRRSLKVLTGSWEELMEKGRELRSDDLIVLRSDEFDLTPEQRADLRVLGPNIVSLEMPALEGPQEEERDESVPLLVKLFQKFALESSGKELSPECLELLLELEEKL